MFAGLNAVCFLAASNGSAAQRAEIMLTHYGIVWQQHTRAESNESPLDHVKIKLVLM